MNTTNIHEKLKPLSLQGGEEKTVSLKARNNRGEVRVPVSSPPPPPKTSFRSGGEKSADWYNSYTSNRVPVPEGAYTDVGYGNHDSQYDNRSFDHYFSRDESSQSSSDDSYDDFTSYNCLFHHVTVESSETDHEKHRRLTLALAQVQYDDDKDVNYNLEYAHVLGELSSHYIGSRKDEMYDYYCPIRREVHDYGVFGKCECAVMHLEAPNIPFLEADCIRDYDELYDRLSQRYAVIDIRNFMSYVGKCHRTISDLVENGYFNVGRVKFDKVIPRCVQAIRYTGKVPSVATMLSPRYQDWISANMLSKGDKTGEFLWDYLFHFSLMYHPRVKTHPRYKLILRAFVTSRVSYAKGHMFEQKLSSMMGNVVKGIPEDVYKDVAGKMFDSLKTQVGDFLTCSVSPEFVEAAKMFLKVVGALISTTIVLFMIRHMIGEFHAFTMFLKSMLFPNMSASDWKASETLDTSKVATGHMWEHIQPLVIRFGIMSVQIITGAPTNAREVSECLRTITYGSSFIETIMTNVEPIFRMAAYKITGDKMWIHSEMDGDIENHLFEVESLRGVGNMNMRLLNDNELCRRVRASYAWHTANLANLRSAGIRDKTLGVKLSRAERDLYKWYEVCVNATTMADSRIVPISIMLSGAVNQGKTSMISAIIKIVHAFYKHRGQHKYDSHTYFSKAKDSEYWDGYNHQITYIVDEFLASCQPTTRDAQIMELLGIVNSGVYPLNFADCKSKGSDVFDSPLVIYTTNFVKWNQIQMTDPEALFKRIHYPLELKRGTNIVSGDDISTAWMVTATKHAAKNQKLYAGTNTAFWKATVKDGGERVWITFKEFMVLVLKEYTLRLDAKPLTDHMGDVQSYCENVFPTFFDDTSSTDVCGGVRNGPQLSSSSSSDDGDNSLLSVRSCSLLDFSESDVETGEGHMFKRIFRSVMGEDRYADDDSSSNPGLASSSSGSYFSHYGDIYLPPGDAPHQEIMDTVVIEDQFKDALEQACMYYSRYDLHKVFGDIYDDILVLGSLNYAGGPIIPVNYHYAYCQMLFAHKAFYRTCVRVAKLKPEWFEQIYPTLAIAADSLDGTIFPRIYAEAFDEFIANYYKFLQHDDGIVLSAQVVAMISPRFAAVSRKHGLNVFLWNVGGACLGERRDNGPENSDVCLEMHDHHVCGAYYAATGANVSGHRRKMNDFVAVLKTVVGHICNNVSTFASTVFADMRTALTPFYVGLVSRLPLICLYVGSIATALALTCVTAGVSALIHKLINSYASSSGHSEHQKNPMFVRKGRVQDHMTKYEAAGHQMQQQDAQIAAVTTRNSLTRYFSIRFTNGEEVEGKCLALGKYLFFHSHVLWAFGEIELLTVCADSRIQTGGSHQYRPSDFILYDYMQDTSNKRDLVRLEFKGKHAYLGKKPSTYLVPRKVWTQQLVSERLIRVLGAGQNRKVSLPHIVPEVFRIGRPYGTKIEVHGEVTIRDHDAGYMAYDTPSLPGDCSDPYISGSYLLGVHVGFANGDSVFMPIYLEDCSDDLGVGAMSYVPKIVATDLYMPSGVVPLGVTERDYTGRAVDPYEATVYGPRGVPDIGGYRPPVFPLNRVPSPLTGLVGLSPWSKHNTNYSRTHSPPPPMDYLLRIKRDPAFYLKDFFVVPNNKKFRRLSDFEVDNGISGYLVGVDPSTSTGLIGKVCHKTREELYERDEKQNLLPGPELVEAADEIANMIRTNTVPMIICCENLKAETIPPDKLPRCFTGVSIEHLRWTKAVVGDALAYMKKHVVGSSCAVGINPHGIQWEMLHDEFVDGFGIEGKIIAGDLSNCDLSCHPIFVQSMCAFLNLFYKYHVDSMAYRELEYCCMSIIFQLRLRGKRMFEIFRGHPSGHYMTTLFNCIVVYSIHRYAYERLVDAVMYPWAKNVRLKVYGDDSLGCVHPRVQKWYNMQTIQPVFSEFGMIYTAPNKDTNLPQFIEREDANFLGRGFRATNTVMCAPLNLDAIYGMVHWVRTEANVVDVALDENIRCALMEMYHHGEKAFKDFRSRLYLEGTKRGYVSGSLTGPLNYEFFREWHVKAYSGCDDAYAFSVDNLTDTFFQI